jgi:hypothetical protein
MMKHMPRATLLAALLCATLLPGCALLVGGAAVGGVMVATDRLGCPA